MINNQGTFSKHASIVPLNGALGVTGPEFSVSSEVKVNVEISGVGGTNVVLVEGRIQNSSAWKTLSTITGAASAIVDTSSVDFIRFNNTVASGTGTIVSSGFITDKSAAGGGGGAGDASAANQLIGNASLASIDAKTPALSGGKQPVIVSNSDSSILVSGQSAVGSAPTLNPVSISGIDDGGLKRHFLTDTTGKLQTVLPANAATADKQDTTNTTLASLVSKLPNLDSGYQPVINFVEKSDGTKAHMQATEGGAVNIGNTYKKFRDGFADLAVGASPDSNIWDVAFTNQGSSFVGRAGDAQGSSYMKVSMCPYTADSEFTMTTKRTFRYPMRFVSLLSLSQRIIGQEFEISIVGVDGSSVITTLTPKADLVISGTVSITTNVATINFATSHGLKTGDRVILTGNTERRLNVGPVTVTVVTALQITVPLTLANGTYTAGGVVRWADPLAYAKNGAGLLYENATATNATFLTRRNGFNTRLLNSTVVTTANATTVNYADPFNATSMNQIIANQEEFTVVPRTPDSIAAPGTPLRWHQGIPDEELEYKLRIRAKNLSNLTRPVAKIVTISKTGTTTATVTTDVPHGLATTDFVQIYGVRDITNFPNLVASTQVASIVSATQFTIVIGTASTSSSVGGAVFLNHGSVLAPGISAVNVQSIARTSNVMTLVGNTTWTGYLPGETIHLYGCDATSMGLYDGAYKVLRILTTSLELESVGADFTTINCGGAVMRRTDFRIHGISEIEHTRLIAELSNSQGSLDVSKSVPTVVTNTAAVTVSSGTVTTVSAVTSANLSLPGIIADVASAALTTTTTTAAITPTFGTAYEVNIPVTAVTGTNPTLDVSIEESDDTGTNWFKVYDFPRITAAGIYRSPKILMTGNRLRYVQTVGGTTPSFTRAVNRLQASDVGDVVRQLVDRSIVLTTLSSTTPSLTIQNCRNLQLLINIGTATTPPGIQMQGSDDNGLTWYNIGTALTAVASSTVSLVVNNVNSQLVRGIVSAAGNTVVAGYVLIKGF